MKRFFSILIFSCFIFSTTHSELSLQCMDKYRNVKQFIKKHKNKLLLAAAGSMGILGIYLLSYSKDKKEGKSNPSTIDEVDCKDMKYKDFHNIQNGDEWNLPEPPPRAGRRWYFGN